MKKIIVFIIVVIGLFHIAWYVASYKITRRSLPDEDTINVFQKKAFKRFEIDIDPNLFKETYIKANGIKLHLDVLRRGKGSPTLVFIPGTSAYARLYSEFMYHMYKKGYNVVGFDPRGHGRSSGPRGDYTIDEIVDDTLAVVKYAGKKFKSKVAVAGSSQGGIVALYAAARDDSLTAVVCDNFAELNGKDNLVLPGINLPGWSVPAVDRIMMAYQNFVVPVSVYLDLSKEILKDGTNAAAYIKDDPLCVSWVTVRALRSLLKTDMAKPVEKISVPLMLIHSERDNIFPQDYVESIYNRLTSEKMYFFLKNEEHLVLTNNAPEVVGTIVRWLGLYM